MKMVWAIVLYLCVIWNGSLTHAADTCSSKLSESNITTSITAGSETRANTASAALTNGWCSQNTTHNELTLTFPDVRGVKGFVIGPNDNVTGSYAVKTQVQYIPNGGSNFVDFPVPGGKLVIDSNGTLTSTMTFNTGVAMSAVKFIVIQKEGNHVCLKVDLLGCELTELCPNGCHNGGLCMTAGSCQCAPGFMGDNCELKECQPEVLGLSDGRIPVSSITTSSEDPDYSTQNLGAAEKNTGWCPAANDMSPFVIVKLEKPRAVSVFLFEHAIRKEGYAKMYIEEFELQYISPLDSSRTFRTFSTNIPALNGTHYFTVTTHPVIVTDEIRIVPSKYTVRPCFKLELKGCDPTQLCSTGFCLNNSTCMGANTCKCLDGFYGERCDQTKNDINATNLAFYQIKDNILLTVNTDLSFKISGNVTLTTVPDKKTPVLTLTGQNSYIQMNTNIPSCITNIDLCTGGFTFALDIFFTLLTDNTIIISSGAQQRNYKGVALYYSHDTLTYIVSSPTFTWTLVVKYVPVLNQWQHFEISWNKHLGIELLLDGKTLGSNGRPAPASNTQTTLVCIGCSPSNVTVNFMVTGVMSWSIGRTELVNAGVKQAPITNDSTTTTSLPSTTTTVATTKTTVSTTTAISTTTVITVTSSAPVSATPECIATDLGLGDGRITAIITSSEDRIYPTTELGLALSNKGWCPASDDQSPWVIIELDQPRALDALSFQYPDRQDGFEKMYMEEFELQYISPLDSSKTFRTFAGKIPALNGTHYFTVQTVPIIVTEQIRIKPSKSTLRACFKMELLGCDPTHLCDYNFCENNSTCMGQNVCKCPQDYFGDNCNETITDIKATEINFAMIKNKTISTTTKDISFDIHGNVNLKNATGMTSPVIALNGAGSYIQLTTNIPSCISNIGLCATGFTFAINIMFMDLPDNTFIFSSGGHLPDHKGVALYYNQNTLKYIVSSSTYTWTLDVPYQPTINKWQNFEITWNKHLGIELLLDGKLLGSNGQPTPISNTEITFVCVGCSHGSNVVAINFMVAGIMTWEIDRTELVNAGLRRAPIVTTIEPPTSVTQDFSTTDISSTDYTTTTVQTTPKPYQEYNLTFITVTGNMLVTPSFNFTLHNKPTLLLENNSHTTLVLDCDKHQYVELPDTGIPCLEDLENCKKGFTFNMELQFTKLDPADKTYILSSGGDVETANGMAIYIQSSQLIFGVKQSFLHWSGTYELSGKLKLNQWYKYEISWSLEKGIAVLIDGQQVIKKVSWTPSPDIPKTNPVLIGKTAGTNSTSCMNVRDLFTWTIHREVLVDQGVLPAPIDQFSTTVTTEPTTTLPDSTTTDLPTTTSLPDTTTTEAPIDTFTWDLIDITNNIVIGNEYNITAHGPTIVKDNGLNFKNGSQYLEFGVHAHSCLLDPLECKENGLTFQFTFEYNRLEENTYLLTSGGEQPDGTGIALVYRFAMLQVIMSTSQFSWYTSLKKNELPRNVPTTMTISWSMYVGLEVFINNVLVTASQTSVFHQPSPTIANVVFFGKQPTLHTNVDFVLQTVTIWHAHIDILVLRGYCKPPVRPTVAPVVVTTAAPTTVRPTITSMASTVPTKQQCPTGCISIGDLTTTKLTTALTPSTPTCPPTLGSTTTLQPTTDKPATARPTTTTTTPGKLKPDYTATPIISIITDGNIASLVCQFSGSIETNVVINASLIINEATVLSKEVSGDSGSVRFSVAKVNMYLYLAKIKCSVKASFTSSVEWTQIFYSNTITPQITVSPGRLTVVEGGDSKYVTITTTAPPQFFCCSGCHADCQVHIVGIFEYHRSFQQCNREFISQAIIGSSIPSTYNQSISGFDLTIDNWKVSHTIEVVATLDNIRDGDHTISLDVTANVYTQAVGTMITSTTTSTSINVNTVTVVVKDNHSRPNQCKSVNDPHLTTFDGVFYNMMHEGQYILYKHATEPFEVRVQYERCSKHSHSTCNCAVAIRSGDDVISVIGCQSDESSHPSQGHGFGMIFQQLFGSHGHAHGHNNGFAETPMKIQIFKNGELTPGTYIKRMGCGQKYEIILPTGMVVTVQQSWKPFINIWITASSSDRGTAQGLCGNFDGSKHNDVSPNTDTFSNQWKIVDSNNNFFTGVERSTLIMKAYCSCINNRGSFCLQGLGMMACTASRYDVTSSLVAQAQTAVVTRGDSDLGNNHRRKRQAEQLTTPQNVIEPDGSEMTYEEAYKQCERFIEENAVTKNCKDLLSNVTEQINNCADDYNSTGNFDWASDAIRDIVATCVDEANYLKTANGTDDDSYVDVKLLDQILEKNCVEDCGEHGECMEGVCVCNEGYTGENCTISKSTLPSLGLVPYICDIDLIDDCMFAPVFGFNFVQSSNLTCRYELIQKTETDVHFGMTGVAPARFITINEVVCVLPKRHSAKIKISNDGSTYSIENWLHITYNSICHECAVDENTFEATCNRRDQNCIINGQCYAGNSSKPDHSCSLCQPQIDPSNWIHSEAHACIAKPMLETGEEEGLNSTQVILVAVVAAVFAVLILGGVGYLIKSKMRRSKTAEFGEYDLTSHERIHRDTSDYDNVATNNPTYQDNI